MHAAAYLLVTGRGMNATDWLASRWQVTPMPAAVYSSVHHTVQPKSDERRDRSSTQEKKTLLLAS